MIEQIREAITELEKKNYKIDEFHLEKKEVKKK